MQRHTGATTLRPKTATKRNEINSATPKQEFPLNGSQAIPLTRHNFDANILIFSDNFVNVIFRPRRTIFHKFFGIRRYLSIFARRR